MNTRRFIAVPPVLSTERVAHLRAAKTAAFRDYDSAYVGSGQTRSFDDPRYTTTWPWRKASAVRCRAQTPLVPPPQGRRTQIPRWSSVTWITVLAAAAGKMLARTMQM